MPDMARIEMGNLISGAATLDYSGHHDHAAFNRKSAKRILGMLGRTTCRTALADMLIEIDG